ncbi:type I polyketide synthase [Oligoflexus tunisiensis]|uniref:type I polyketide synthase n=1 Tax=Oligoflexus tunisiensis TaxID=708132 RepID=UPI000AB67579|nr:type I polyketide synthase [Oligoflexus tunisiensis]
MKKQQERGGSIAIIGMSCWYPGAQTLVEFWENILSKRQQFRRMPDERLPLQQYHSSDRATPDKTYGTEAAVLDGFEFDWKGRRIPKQTFESTDIVHWLALDVALKALEDSGLDLASLQKLQTGVVLGNTLTGEWTRTNAMRMRWPYVERVMRETAAARGMSGANLDDYLRSVEEAFKSVFPTVNEDTLAGALSNTIAGRICNFLDLHGGGYTVDGACSSSLLAVINAARSLSSGDLDVAFAGGIDISLDTFELIGFAKTGALTPDDMRVYDKRANGFIPGEGCGFVVLKRLADAERDGDRIYAVLKGWGLSSDGKGGMTAPSIQGQASAISKAYTMAGYGLESCDFVEGHGTGTTVGDKVEISALVEVLGDKVPAKKIGLTSLKSIVGHTKAAAGIGAFIKTAIAVNQRVQPPMAGVEEPNALFQEKARFFHPLIEGQKYSEDRIVRAGVSAMGFGGINTHATLESYGAPAEHLRPRLDERIMFHSHDKAEVLVYSASSQALLQKKLQQALTYARRISRAELADLAQDSARFVQNHEPWRATVVVSKPEEAFQALNKLVSWMEQPLDQQTSREQMEGSTFISLGHSSRAPKLGFLFPGQGAQKPNMGRKLTRRHSWAQSRLETADAVAHQTSDIKLSAAFLPEMGSDLDEAARQLARTELAQPAISLVNALWFEMLQKLGLTPSIVGGHSLGELSALYAGKAFDFETLIQLAAVRGQLMANRADRPGAMIHLNCDAATALQLIETVSGTVSIANRNAHDQTVLSGDPEALQSILETAKARGIQGGLLPVSNAFHSVYMEEAAAAFAKTLAKAPVKKPTIKFFRGTDGQAWSPDADVKDYLSQQILQQVDFIALAESMRAECDLLIEVGPSQILSGLVKRMTGSTLCLPTESRPGFDADLKILLAVAFTKGAAIRWEELYQARYLRPFIRPEEKHFIHSPTERPLQFSSGGAAPVTIAAPAVAPVANPVPAAAPAPTPAATAPSAPPAGASIEDVIYGTINALTGFERSTLKPEMRLLDDLNMDSIKASELMANVTMHYGIAGELESTPYANASIQEIAAAIREKIGSGAQPSALAPAATPAVDAPKKAAPVSRVAETSLSRNKEPWVRNFTEVFERSSPLVSGSWSETQVTVLAASHDTALKDSWLSALELQGATINEQGSVQIILLPTATHDAQEAWNASIALLAQVGRTPWKKGQSLIFVQGDDGIFGRSDSSQQLISGKAFAQSLAHERPDLKIRVISVPRNKLDDTESLLPKLAAEKDAAENLLVAGYDAAGIRFQPQLQLDQTADYPSRTLTLSDQDVVLVTGGAKGITAACALAMARTYGTRMALIGSSSLTEEDANNPEHPIQKTLQSYRDAGLTAAYYACNITEADDVSYMIDRIRSELGEPSALIHGAGSNQPRPVSSVKAADAEKEMAPKIVGMRNLLNAMNGTELKLIVGLTSVIGVTGMPGNAWYGFANEALDLMIRRYRAQHPATQTQTVAYSVWAEVGMGARMGSDKNLEQKGISSISPEQGIQRFMQLIQSVSRDQQTVVCSRLGAIGAQAMPRLDHEHLALNFARDIVHHQSGVETIARVHLNYDEHAYLLDHNYKGAYLLPTVHGLEAMAQIVSLQKDLGESLVLENIQLTRPITVGQQGCTIEIHAEVLEQNTQDDTVRVRAGIRTALSGYKVDHFAAEFVLQARAVEMIEGIPVTETRLAVDPMRQLYGSILFQGPKFQRIQSLHHLESDNETEGRTLFLARTNAGDLSTHTLGDPYFRDALLQSAQIIIPQNQCLPIEIERLELHRGYNNEVERLCWTDVHKVDAKSYSATITVFNPEGRILERMVNYRLQFLEKKPQLPKAMDLIQAEALPANENSLLAPYRGLAKRLVIDAEPNGPQDQSVFVHRFIPDFKTFANLNRSIYFSHFFNWMGQSREMSSLPVLDRIRELTETGRWGQVTNWASIEVLGECRNRDRVVEARMWCGQVTGSRNSSATLNFDWVSLGENGIEERIATGQMGFTWVEILDHGIVRPAEFPAEYRDFIASMIARNDRPNSYIPAAEPYRNLDKGSTLFQAQEGPNTAVQIAQKVFDTSLFDANLVGNLYFGNYSIWMGKLRDTYFHGLAPHLYRGIGEAGELTCVKSRIQHLREAMPFDDILVTMGIKAVYQNGVDLQFEFHKVTPQGQTEKLATADHRAIWTRPGADGEKVACELPPDIMGALIEHVEISLLKTVI